MPSPLTTIGSAWLGHLLPRTAHLLRMQLRDGHIQSRAGCRQAHWRVMSFVHAGWLVIHDCGANREPLPNRLLRIWRCSRGRSLPATVHPADAARQRLQRRRSGTSQAACGGCRSAASSRHTGAGDAYGCRRVVPAPQSKRKRIGPYAFSRTRKLASLAASSICCLQVRRGQQGSDGPGWSTSQTSRQDPCRAAGAMSQLGPVVKQQRTGWSAWPWQAATLRLVAAASPERRRRAPGRAR